MRHAARRNLRNGSIVVGVLFVALLSGALVTAKVTRIENVQMTQKVENLYVCAREVEPESDPAPKIWRRHFPRKPRAPVACTPLTSRLGEPVRSVPEPATWSIVALGVSLMVWKSRA